MSTGIRNGQGFVAKSLIGTLGGLIGLGGTQFRLPMLIGVFRLGTLEAVILDKAMSLVGGGDTITLPRRWLNRIVMALLVCHWSC